MYLALGPEDGSKLLLVFLEETWVVEDLLEEISVGVVLVVDLQLSSWKSALSGMGTRGIVEGHEGLVLEQVGEHLSLLVGDEINELSGEPFSFFF